MTRITRIESVSSVQSAVKCSPLAGLFQTFDVDFLHFEHGLHDSFRFLRIGITQHLPQNSGIDLPRQTILVFQPTAWPFFSTLGKLCPQFVHFLLRCAVHGERYGLSEFELGAEGVR